MSRGLFSGNDRTKNILLTLAKVGVFAIGATSPYFLHNLIKHYFDEPSAFEKRQIARRMRELQKRKVLNFEHLSDHSVKITLSHNGRRLVRQYQLDKMRLQKPKRWDARWRIVIYDIPSSQRRASNAFREKLRQLGLYQLQKSVWISPYDCLAELEFLCAVFELEMIDVVCYFTTPELPKEQLQKIKGFFNL